MRVDGVRVHVHVFGTAGHEHGQNVLLVVIFVFPVIFDHAAQSQLLEQLLRALERLAALFCDLCRCDRHALVHDDGDLRHLIRHDVFQPQIFR